MYIEYEHIRVVKRSGEVGRGEPTNPVCGTVPLLAKYLRFSSKVPLLETVGCTMCSIVEDARILLWCPSERFWRAMQSTLP